MIRYDHYPGDYLAHTLGLSLLQDGIYRRLLDSYYTTERPIPDAEKFDIVRARNKKERDEVCSILERFFVKVGAEWRHRRVDEEIQKARHRIDAAKQNGKRGGRPKQLEPEQAPLPQNNPGGLIPLTQPLTQTEPKNNPVGGVVVVGGINKEIECPADLAVNAHQRANLTMAGVADWAIDQMTAGLRSRWCGDTGKRMTLDSWRKYLAASLKRQWENPKERPTRQRATHEGRELSWGDA